MKPAIQLTGLSVANPAGFSQRNIIDATEVAATIDLSSAMQKRIAITSLEIHEPKILIESTADGKTNLEKLLNNVEGKTQQPASVMRVYKSNTWAPAPRADAERLLAETDYALVGVGA